MPKKVLVSGCFDLLHSGHVEFLQSAARLGERLFVCLGSDRTVFELKGRWPVCSEKERLFMVAALGCVAEARVSRGSGRLDFLPELEDIRPDVLAVNEDGDAAEKAEICSKMGIEYRVLRREPHAGMPPRSTTSLRGEPVPMPFRIDFCGGWLDQPMVNRLAPGAVVVASLEPTVAFNDRSGMASSTRKTALRTWPTGLPTNLSPADAARQLFALDNPPGTRDVAGSQDALGICLPSLSRLEYADGDFWPKNIESCHAPDVLDFLEKSVFLIEIGPRHSLYTVTDRTDLTAEKAQKLASAADLFWSACLEKDLEKLGRAMRDGARAQWSMFPKMKFEGLEAMISEAEKRGALGWKLSGAGGGGYLTVVSDGPIEGATALKIRRRAIF